MNTHNLFDRPLMVPDGDCPRTLAMWRPGFHVPGVNHRYAWAGSMPCTGRLRCTLCGQDAPEEQQ